MKCLAMTMFWFQVNYIYTHTISISTCTHTNMAKGSGMRLKTVLSLFLLQENITEMPTLVNTSAVSLFQPLSIEHCP